MARRKSSRRRAPRRRTYRRRTSRRRTPEKSIGLGDIAVAGFAAERFGLWDATENTIAAAVGILQGGGVDIASISRGIIAPVRAGMTLQNALQVGAAAGITGIIRRVIPGSGKAIAKVPSGIPLLGGYRIKRF